MAKRRMFNQEIVESDAFLDMPLSTQALYFHLGMYADDDGFVSPRKIMRILGAQDDDLKVLVGKRFVLPFKNGVLVMKHWRMNNFIRKDRYKPTAYLEQREQLYVKENGAYTEDPEQGTPLLKAPWVSEEDERSTNGQPEVNLGEERLGKVRKEEGSSSFKEKRKPYYLGEEMRKTKDGKWWVLPGDGGTWLEFADSEDKIEWK